MPQHPESDALSLLREVLGKLDELGAKIGAVGTSVAVLQAWKDNHQANVVNQWQAVEKPQLYARISELEKFKSSVVGALIVVSAASGLISAIVVHALGGK